VVVQNSVEDRYAPDVVSNHHISPVEVPVVYAVLVVAPFVDVASVGVDVVSFAVAVLVGLEVVPAASYVDCVHYVAPSHF